MKGMLESFPIALRMIFKDPINLLLSLFPTVIALGLYAFTITTVYRESDRVVSFFRGYIYTADQATIYARILTAVLIIFIFFVMSWTFVLIVGIVAAPFNSLLSARIEQKLITHKVDNDKTVAMQKVGKGLLQTFKNEFKKLFFILFVAVLAFLLNFFPLFYPVGILLVAALLAVQFIDYSWSRHDLHFGSCLKDVMVNILPYSVSGFFFLMLVAIPVVNAFVPAFATSYFTVLWLSRQNKI